MEHLPLISLLSCLLIHWVLPVYLFDGVLCDLLVSEFLYDFQLARLFFVELRDGFHGDDPLMDGISWAGRWLKEGSVRHLFFTFLLLLYYYI